MSIEIEKIVTGFLSNNNYLITNTETNEAFIIDPSFKTKEIIDFIDSKNIILKGILLTHGHFDHIYSVNDIKNKYGVSAYGSNDEKELFYNDDKNLSCLIGKLCMRIIPDIFFNDGDLIDMAGFKIKVISTPGHTKGSVCFYIEDEKVLFTGDTLFYHSYGTTSFPTGNDDEMVSSLNKKIFTLPKDVICYPAHGNITNIEEEILNNPIERN